MIVVDRKTLDRIFVDTWARRGPVAQHNRSMRHTQRRIENAERECARLAAETARINAEIEEKWARFEAEQRRETDLREARRRIFHEGEAAGLSPHEMATAYEKFVAEYDKK